MGGCNMNTMSLNAEFFRELSYIADDEILMKKVLNYIKKQVSYRQKTDKQHASSMLAEQAEEYRPLTKEELIADINEMCENVKQIRAGKLNGRPAEELLYEL